MKLKIFFLFFFLNLSHNLIRAQQDDSRISFDSIYNVIKFYSRKNEYKNALKYSKRLLLKAQENKNSWQQGKSLYRIAEFQRKLNFKDSAYYYYFKSKELFLKVNDSIQIGRVLLNIAIIESNYGSYSASDSTAVEAIKYINGNRNRTTASAFNCLAINSKKRFLFKDAIKFYKNALKISPFKSSKIIYKNNLSIIYKDLKDFSKSILILENLLKDSITNKKTKARIIDNLAYTKWLSNPKNKVLNQLLLAESIRKKEQDNYGLIASYAHLSDYYLDNNDNSLFYAKKMYRTAKDQKAINSLLEAIDKIVKLESPKKAIKYYQESIKLRDSVQKENIKRQNKFAKIKYDYEEEEKLKLRFKTLAAENKLKAEQENNQKQSLVIFTILLIIGLSFLFYRRKQQEKRKVIEANYKTETRIAKKLHDELGNDIFNVITKIQNTNNNTNEIVNDLDKLYLKTRTISHENDEILTGKDFEDYLYQLIVSYHSEDIKIILKDFSVLELNSLKKEKQRILYRVFNELLVNLKKHSKANLVVISCEKTGNFLNINYADNGVGFKNNKVVLKNGLANMETRIKSIEGTLNFESITNKGLKIKIRFKK